MKKPLIIIIAVVVVLGLAAFLFKDKLKQVAFQPESTFTGESGLVAKKIPVPDIKLIAEDLDVPWEIIALPSGKFIVTERTGNLVLLSQGDNRMNITLDGVEPAGEGGLLGAALHPDYENNNQIYLYLTAKEGDTLINRVVRYVLSMEGSVSGRTVIMDGLPAANFHNGGRIKFGPDGKLYITTGDAGQSDLAQSLDYLGGKILRLNADGTVPADNPFAGSPVWSYGHRNPQGLAWDDENNLWAVEHGRSGTASGYDEVNLIEAGNNYGWPVIEGDAVQDGMVGPKVHSGADYTWAPAGLVFLKGNLFFGGLRGEGLYQYEIASGKLTRHFFGEYGRVRAVTLSPNSNDMYITTSNRDGRGTVRDGDDRVIRINPNLFF